jgi:hypothetical protein
MVSALSHAAVWIQVLAALTIFFIGLPIVAFVIFLAIQCLLKALSKVRTPGTTAHLYTAQFTHGLRTLSQVALALYIGLFVLITFAFPISWLTSLIVVESSELTVLSGQARLLVYSLVSALLLLIAVEVTVMRTPSAREYFSRIFRILPWRSSLAHWFSRAVVLCIFATAFGLTAD